MKRTSLVIKLIIGLIFLFAPLGSNRSFPVHALSNKAGITSQVNLAQTDNIVFAVIGDYGVANSYENDVANLIKGWNPNFIVTVGDNNYPNGAASSIDENIGQFFHDFIFPYRGRYGSGADTNRFFPALGNHDWMANGANPFVNYFALPGNERYYDFVQGSVHFFVLDSDPNEPDGVSATSKQAKWLKNGLAASTSAFNLVFAHHPPYSSGTHGSTAYMQWPFKDWGADAVITGHDHLYERLLVHGLPYFVNGMGGSAPLYNFLYSLPESQVRFNQDFGAMRVEASSTHLTLQAITRTGNLIDEYTIGTMLPSVTGIRRANVDPSNLTSVDFAVTFSEAVSGVDASDFAVVSAGIPDAAIGNVSGSGSAYTISVNTGTGDGTLRLDFVDDDSVLNDSGNPPGGTGAGNGNYSSGETYTIDRTAPAGTSITLTSPSPSNDSSVDFAVTFSEPVSGVDATDFVLGSTTSSGASIYAVNGTGNSYIVSVNTGTGDDVLRLDLNDDDSIIDAAGNPLGGAGTGNGSLAGSDSYIVDRTSPLVTSIIRGNPDPTSASTVDFIVTFSEVVTGVDALDFTLTTTGVAGASISAISDSNPFFVVTVNTGVGTGTIRLDFVDDDTVTDSIGNPTGSAGIGNGTFASGEIYTINKTFPYVVSILRANSSPTGQVSVDFTVTFSEAVTGVDATDFNLTGSTINDATIAGVNGVGSAYTVSVLTGSGDGVIQLGLIDDDSIINSSGVNLGEPGIGNGNFTNGESYVIDKTAPVVTSIIRASPNPASTASVDFIVTFSEAVTGVDSTDFRPVTDYLYGVSILTVQNMDPFYIVTVRTGAGTGWLRIDFSDNDTVTDPAANPTGGVGNGTGDFTTGEVFNINKPSLNFLAPVPHAVRRLTNDSTPTFYWYPAGVGRLYEIVIASDISFSQMVTSQVVRSLSATANPPLPDGRYFWHVRAYNRDFQPGRFSTTQSFTLDTVPPAIPGLTNPPQNSTSNRRPTFQWTPADSAVNYHIEVDNNDNFSSPEFAKLTTGTTIRSSYLPRGVFFWHVRAKDEAGNWSEWSSPASFIIP